MDLKKIVLFLAIFIITVISKPTQFENDSNNAETNFFKSIVAAPQLSDQVDDDDLNSYPYEGYHDIANTYGKPPQPQPSFGVSVNTQAVLAPHVEIFRLLEGFLRLKGEVIKRFQALINDNWDLIRAIINLIIGKIQNVHSFTLKGISVIRQVIEFALNLFADWSITLPSLTLGTSGTSHTGTYGSPPASSAALNFLSGLQFSK